MALHIPVHGEELFELSYKDISNGKANVKGQFYSRLKSEKNLAIYADRFVGGLGFLLGLKDGTLLKQCRESVEDQSLIKCKAGKREFDISMVKIEEGHTEFDLVISSDKLRVKIVENASTKGQKGHYPNRLDFILSSEQGSGLSLALFPTSCLQ